MENQKFSIESIGRIIHMSERAMVNRLQKNFKSAGFDVTSEQWEVLIILWNRDGQTQQFLSQKTGKDKTSITRLINGLEKRNLVVRIPHPSDARSKLIYLTPKGKTVQEDLIEIAKRTLKQAQNGITVQEMDTCKAILNRMIQNLS